MARTAIPKVKIYKETMEDLLHEKRLSKKDFCDAMGHTASWYPMLFQRGYAEINKANLKLWAFALGCVEDDLTKIPVSPQGKRKQEEAKAAADNEVLAMLANTQATMIDGFAMIHQDIQMLIETMHKYWKSEEPKYEVKEREQP